MTISIEGCEFEEIVAFDGVERCPRYMLLAAQGRKLRWVRRNQLWQRTEDGYGLVVEPDKAWRPAVLVDKRRELVLVCKPAVFWCPICWTPAGEGTSRDYGERIGVDCSRCGRLIVTKTALRLLHRERDEEAMVVPRV